MADTPLQPDDAKTPSPLKEEVAPPEKPSFELSSNAEVLKNFDAFEVEDMPESNELQERRRKIKNQLKELEVDPRNSGDEAFASDEEGGFLDILHEAGLGARQFKFCCGGVLVLLVFVGLLYGGFRLLTGVDWSFPDFGGDEEPPVETPSEEDPSDVPDATLWLGMDLGATEFVNSGSTETGEDLGLSSNRDDSLQNHVNAFSRIYEAARTDVNELLNQSSNRREALEVYQNELLFYYQDALDAQAVLEQESTLLTKQYAAVEDEKNTQEALFFEELNSLDAYASTTALNAFVGYSQELIRLRAHTMARESLLSYYENLLPFVEAKIRDIELNEEALVKGIKVVEVDGSDLNLILNEEDL